MKALSLAYLAGVIVGDGWCTKRELGLKVKDLDFAQAFSKAIYKSFNKIVLPKLYRGYWNVRSSNMSGRYDSIISENWFGESKLEYRKCFKVYLIVKETHN